MIQAGSKKSLIRPDSCSSSSPAIRARKARCSGTRWRSHWTRQGSEATTEEGKTGIPGGMPHGIERTDGVDEYGSLGAKAEAGNGINDSGKAGGGKGEGAWVPRSAKM